MADRPSPGRRAGWFFHQLPREAKEEGLPTFAPSTTISLPLFMSRGKHPAYCQSMPDG
jgi:hypothetical protein